jgi:hypothetical protein
LGRYSPSELDLNSLDQSLLFKRDQTAANSVVFFCLVQYDLAVDSFSDFFGCHLRSYFQNFKNFLLILGQAAQNLPPPPQTLTSIGSLKIYFAVLLHYAD